MSGGSKHKSNSASAGMGIHSSLPSTKQSNLCMKSTKASHLQRIPNASVISAAPASHPPVLAQYGAQSLDNSQNNILEVSNTAAKGLQNQGSASGVQNMAQRSLSRARQFGKDLTNMFSFSRSNQSRQSSKQTSSNH